MELNSASITEWVLRKQKTNFSVRVCVSVEWMHQEINQNRLQ